MIIRGAPESARMVPRRKVKVRWRCGKLATVVQVGCVEVRQRGPWRQTPKVNEAVWGSVEVKGGSMVGVDFVTGVRLISLGDLQVRVH